MFNFHLTKNRPQFGKSLTDKNSLCQWHKQKLNTVHSGIENKHRSKQKEK